MPHRIRCSVSNCHYWKQDNICSASQIMITSDTLAQAKPDSFDAPQASVASPTPAGRCEETCCKTFVKKDYQKAYEDNVQKM
ncbi:MAG TPA: DUF1540 domain-containing protein [Firmicutes bacterium]|nr:DUF1540 domain-containing protein [Bacillota bacterium]HOB89621.1 DUF1540 domain-containing protein [Bacillota bacterium]HPU62301.1 DUF1540 domain-containing protein [Bacillota bacterium]HPZ93221.1 DUF1540 domain-containing protein [Bacillota bacterium]HQE04527.1 DUF1540 domain-containing protein [Bacillota bacterium]